MCKRESLFKYLFILGVLYCTVLILSCGLCFKENKSATMNIFRFFYFLFKSFVKVELSFVFTINMFTIAENYTEK